MTNEEAAALAKVSDSLAVAQAEVDRIRGISSRTWTLEDLRHELARWERELRDATGDAGQPYSPDTIHSHIGHSAQFIRWLAGEWQPRGPRSRS